MANIVKITYEDEMRKSYLDYAMSVIVQRALPDIRDGLKPVHRRILFAMDNLGLTSEKGYKKSARIVGDVLGKYHPHGDSSIYNAMVAMSQDFKSNHSLVDGYGNFGSIDGDGAAAMRYTEARVSKIGAEMLRNLNEDIVKFKYNFDNTLKEPEVLPVRFPNLLLNGSDGIAVGMKTSIPPHNLKELLNASIKLVDENLTNKELMKYVKGPDFPTGATIANKNDLLNIYEKGTGSIRIRATLKTEDIGYGRKNIVITEIPYTQSGRMEKLKEEIVGLIADKKLSEIVDLRDESAENDIRICLEVKKGVDIENLKNKLYKMTKLEDNFQVIMLAIDGGVPRIFSLKEVLINYIEFLKQIEKNKIEANLRKNKEREEILRGLIKSADCVDLIIDVIRSSKTIKDAKDCLVNGNTKNLSFKTKKNKDLAEKLLFTEKQANAILGMQLQRLVGLEIEKLNTEYKTVIKEIKREENLLSSEEDFNELIKSVMEEIKKKYGRNRKTKIEQIEKAKNIGKIEIMEENVYVLIDKFNFIKVVNENSFLRTSEENLTIYKERFFMKNTDTLCFFTNDGEMHQIRIRDLPVVKVKDKGEPIENLIEVDEDKIIKKGAFNDLGEQIIFVTKNGFIKTVEKEDIESNRKVVASTKLEDGDILVSLMDVKDEVEITIETEKERELRFMIEEIPLQKKNARGVKGINLNNGDFVRKAFIHEITDKPKRKRGQKGEIKNQIVI